MNYNTKHVVRLTEEERDELQGVVGRGKVAAATRTRAQVLLKADAGAEGSGPTDAQVAEALEVSTRAVNRVRKAYVEVGLKVTARRTIVDFAHVLRDLSDVHFPQAEKIVLVMDNLNTHKLSTLYRAFPPQEARRLYERFEVHHTPKHASWLNMAECELSVLGRQCLSRRIDSQDVLTTEVAAWQQPRNTAAVRADWQFRTSDARIKLKRLYPTLAPISCS